MKLSERDKTRLKGVHPMLVEVLKAGYARFDKAFADAPSFKVFVIEGVRSIEKQREYVATGASRTMNSRHLTGHAVDLGIQSGTAMRWEFEVYRRLWLQCIQPASEVLGVQVEWGGIIFGPRFLDGPHFQLSPQVYRA